jgi:hypothetical protein
MNRCLLSAMILFAVAAPAFDPPTDTAGPLTVRMQAPAMGAYGSGGFAELSQPGVPVSLPVMLQNSADVPLTGTLRVAVIERWRVDPAGPISFRVGPRGRARHEFTRSFAPGTENAHYPVHAYAEFEYQGQKLTAHPVLILQTKLPNLPRPRLPVEWKPVPAPVGGTLGLGRSPVRRESAEIANTGAEAGRRPPSMRETVEAVAVEYPLRLDFAVSGTATFKVTAEGTVVFESAAGGSAWEQASVDLAKYAGSDVRLRLETRGAVRPHWSQLPWKLPLPRPTEAIRVDGDDVVISCAAGGFAYRLQ